MAIICNIKSHCNLISTFFVVCNSKGAQLLKIIKCAYPVRLTQNLNCLELEHDGNKLSEETHVSQVIGDYRFRKNYHSMPSHSSERRSIPLNEVNFRLPRQDIPHEIEEQRSTSLQKVTILLCSICWVTPYFGKLPLLLKKKLSCGCWMTSNI